MTVYELMQRLWALCMRGEGDRPVTYDDGIPVVHVRELDGSVDVSRRPAPPDRDDAPKGC